jgi:hypothetical protein
MIPVNVPPTPTVQPTFTPRPTFTPTPVNYGPFYMYFDEHPSYPVPVISLSETRVPQQQDEIAVWIQTGRLCIMEPGDRAYIIKAKVPREGVIAVEVATGLCAGYRGWTAVELAHELPLNVKSY